MELPKYSFVEYMAALEGDDFFCVEDRVLKWMTKNLRVYLHDIQSKAEVEYWNPIDYLICELKLYQMYRDSSEQ